MIKCINLRNVILRITDRNLILILLQCIDTEGFWIMCIIIYRCIMDKNEDMSKNLV